jgi:hypothetical protein
MLRNDLHFTHCASSQALGFKDINGESIQSVLEMLFNRVLYLKDAWNMVSNSRCFPFLVG